MSGTTVKSQGRAQGPAYHSHRAQQEICFQPGTECMIQVELHGSLLTKTAFGPFPRGWSQPPSKACTPLEEVVWDDLPPQWPFPAGLALNSTPETSRFPALFQIHHQEQAQVPKVRSYHQPSILGLPPLELESVVLLPIPPTPWASGPCSDLLAQKP